MSVGYVRGIDGLRGVAVTIVMLFHFYPLAFTGGFVGVDVFFVISGFLITLIFIDEKNKSGYINIKNFILKRVIRLVPAMLVMLFFLSLWLYSTLSRVAFEAYLFEFLSALFYVSNWVRAFDGHAMPYLGHTWSLSIEEQFYILWPLLFLAMTKNRGYRELFVVVCFLFCLVAVYRYVSIDQHIYSIKRLYNGFDTRADSLLAGCILALLMSGEKSLEFLRSVSASWQKKIIWLASLFMLLAAMLFVWYEPYVYRYGLLLVYLASAALIAVIYLKGEEFDTPFEHPAVVYVGKISYGLYLWHYPVFKLSKAQYGDGFGVLLWSTTLVFIVAVLSFKYVESPLRVLLRKRFSLGLV